VPVIFLTSKDEEMDRILGLELGADDYVVKPFSPPSWWPRVNACCDASGHFHAGDDRLVRGKLASTWNRIQRHGTAGGVVDRHRVRVVEGIVAQRARLHAREPDDGGLSNARLVSDRTSTATSGTSAPSSRRGAAIRLETVHGVGYKLAAD